MTHPKTIHNTIPEFKLSLGVGFKMFFIFLFLKKSYWQTVVLNSGTAGSIRLFVGGRFPFENIAQPKGIMGISTLATLAGSNSVFTAIVG
jgi:hypothetical protein